MSVDEFRSRIGGSSDSVADALITGALVSASEQIDESCAQSFGQITATNYFTVPSFDVLETPPLVSITQLATDDGSRTYPTVWAITDYDLYPYDAEQRNVPFTEIRRSPIGVYSWPGYVRGVRISGVWGWPRVPSTISEACYLLANRLISLWTAPFGKTGAGEMGAGLNMTAAMTPIIKEMLSGYRALVIV